ncbi:amylosucrase [Novosphingobium sp. Rr 2-17]|uniref:alpha-amylase family glycosyl hydrolase n=1 Tax=Novosphingobium sp. Rr 2-17 TaxID=555793 RepID=UPI0002697ECD|nr:alpha-amylase family glycosyl hydrolase [Novosphingobium sp. Rr 2-17]EIZ79008.1 amylosucrase [Novosphingobium sp. Rr 2-17]
MIEDLRSLFGLLEPLYQAHPAWPVERDRIGQVLATAAEARSPALRALDADRAARPAWFGAPDMIGYSFYVDRFAGTVAGLQGRLPWLETLGVRLLHPLPMTRGQAGDSDGGFAVADYRAIEPALGSLDDVRALATDLHGRGMALAMDCVLNHTARDHAWAQAALAGDVEKRGYYRILDDADDVTAWEADLDEVFPDTAPGNFTHEPALGGWVWTSFYPFQWDLDWSNPAVFREMLDVLLFWANVGVDAFRLDSAPYLWKRRGTVSRNLPETHTLVAALRAGLDAVAPGVALLAEAIERTADVLPYIEPQDGTRAAQLAYHNGVMAALWVALATGDAAIIGELVRDTVLTRADTAWLSYLRCHDDIIWSALNGRVAADELDRISDFYAGAGGFADGRRFQARPGAAPSTVGMLASLVGTQGARALDRYRLLLATMLALPGMPMLYMGDEIGLPNHVDPAAPDDARWLHRPPMDWPRADAAAAGEGPGAQWLSLTRRLIAVRASLPALDAKAATMVRDDAPGLLVVERGSGDEMIVLVANFGERPQPLPLDGDWKDAIEDRPIARLIAPGCVFWAKRRG